MKLSIVRKSKQWKNRAKKIKYNLDGQNAKISPLSSRNVSEYKFFTGKLVLTEEDLLQKPATLNRLKYPLLGKELRVQTDIANTAQTNEVFH